MYILYLQDTQFWLSIFQVVNNHMWLVATVLDRIGLENNKE